MTARSSTGRCVICKGGPLLPGHTTVTLERGGATLVVKEVPALVCQTCGEAYVEGEVTRKLLEDAEASARGGVEVDVRRFLAA